MQEFEKRAAQLDGAKLEHFQQLNNSLKIAEVEAIAQAEEHAKELKRVVTELQQWVWIPRTNKEARQI